MDPRVRRRFLLCVLLSVLLVLTGWVVSIRQALKGDVGEIREALDASFEQAGQEFQQIKTGAGGYAQDVGQSLQTAKESYEATKAKE